MKIGGEIVFDWAEWRNTNIRACRETDTMNRTWIFFPIAFWKGLKNCKHNIPLKVRRYEVNGVGNNERMAYQSLWRAVISLLKPYRRQEMYLENQTVSGLFKGLGGRNNYMKMGLNQTQMTELPCSIV